MQIAALPADKRESARKKRLAQFTHEVDDHIDDIVRQCRPRTTTTRSIA